MTTYHSFSSASGPTTHLVAWKSIANVSTQKVARRPERSPPPPLPPPPPPPPPSPDSLVQNCMTLLQWLLLKTAAFYTEQCANASLFYNFKVVQTGH